MYEVKLFLSFCIDKYVVFYIIAFEGFNQILEYKFLNNKQYVFLELRVAIDKNALKVSEFRHRGRCDRIINHFLLAKFIFTLFVVRNSVFYFVQCVFEYEFTAFVEKSKIKIKKIFQHL